MDEVSVDSAVMHRGVVLLVGGGGFIGGYLASALRRRGWKVLCAVRKHGQELAADERECHLERMPSAQAWMPLLEGVDAVVNAAGILRETKTQRFDTIHYTAPLALAQACAERGIRRFVQISALGVPEDGEFIASKHRFDEALMQSLPSAVVLRPSVVYSTGGSYGGSSLLRAMAAFPGVVPIPGDGRWQIQPIAVEDLGEMVACGLNTETVAGGIYEIGGPAPVSLRDYQLAWRAWLRIPGRRVLCVPEAWVSLVVKVGERIGRGPMGETMWRMIRRGNVATPEAVKRSYEVLGVMARALPEVLADRPSQVQDRWQAQLYLVAPVLRIAVVALWLISALAGFITPAATIEDMASGSWLAGWEPVLLARAGGIVDLLLGGWLLSHWRPRAAIVSMLALLAVYTLVLGIGLPAIWLDPLGGLTKNLVLLPALCVLWVLSERR
ncbi:MAG: SDR family oxidoreductase [Xanthomonadaceae bacterium]|jgi:uncharacterized protein YbjT (DUF2867 family)|nr:SDR family oxidoreductase [Xanthomonadaceae bacterium]